MSDSSEPSPSFSEREDLEPEIEILISNLLKVSVTESKTDLITFEDPNSEKKFEEMPIPNFSKVHAETIPEFDGDVNELNFFLESIDNIVDNFFDKTNESNYQNVIIYQTIISKLKGPAREVINISCVNTIPEIKAELIRNFSDPRNENCLSFDLNNLRQNYNETPYQFHDRVRKLLNTISNYLAIHETDINLRKFKQNMYNKQALEVFLAGLKNPYGIMVRTKEPKTMLEAINFIKKEENIKYLQSTHTNFVNQSASQSKKNSIKQSAPNFPNQRFHAQVAPSRIQGLNFNYNHSNNNNQFRQFTSETPKVQPRPPFPTGPINIQQRQNLPPQRYPTHSQVFGTPKNVWRPNPKFNVNSLDKPTPMSVSTRQTTPTQRPQPQPSTSKWYSEELYNTEQTDGPEENFVFPENELETEYEYSESFEDEHPENFTLDQSHTPET